MDNKTHEQLIYEWKQIRANFFNHLKEDEIKFEKSYKKHPFYFSVKKHFDKSFKEVNQIAKSEIDLFLKKKKENR